jgi:hypothetical protein
LSWKAAWPPWSGKRQGKGERIALASRLKRLETAMSGNGGPDRKSCYEIMADLAADQNTVRAWLEQHGYENALEAIAAGETGPCRLGNLPECPAGCTCSALVVPTRGFGAAFVSLGMVIADAASRDRFRGTPLEIA